MVIVAPRGITGGISIGVTYFVTLLGLSVPPGMWGMACSIQPVCVATYQAIVVAPVSLRKLRRVGMVPPPVGTAVAGRDSLAESTRRTSRAWASGSSPGTGAARILQPRGHERYRGIPGRRGLGAR